MPSVLNLSGQTGVWYEVEIEAFRYGEMSWGRTSYGYFDSVAEAVRAARETPGNARVARVEVTRTIFE